MKYLSINLTVVLSLLFFGLTTSNAQFAAELRPFDFNDSFYRANGIHAGTLLDRRNGDDKKSVFDTSSEPGTHSNVRIIETLPAYATDGSPIFWNRYAIAIKESFTSDDAGRKTLQIAAKYPVYVFPSRLSRGIDRQAAMIAIDDQYFESNPLGIGDLVAVVFNDNISRAGQATLQLLAERNGTTLDGTPIIRTMAELKSLATDGLVTLQVDEGAPATIAKVIQYPSLGGITPDAYLAYVQGADGQPLLAERHFVTQFGCYRNGSRTCLSGKK